MLNLRSLTATAVATDVAANGASGWTHEDIMNLILITIPTVLLFVSTLIDNERMFKLAKEAVAKRKHRGRHQRPRGVPAPVFKTEEGEK